MFALQQLLSECHTASVNIQLGGDASAKMNITREKFEELCEEDFRRIYDPLKRVRAREAGRPLQPIIMGSRERHKTRVLAAHAAGDDMHGWLVMMCGDLDLTDQEHMCFSPCFDQPLLLQRQLVYVMHIILC